MQNVPIDNSHDPMAWQRAADALIEVGQIEAADICRETAGEMMRDANANDTEVVVTIKI